MPDDFDQQPRPDTDVTRPTFLPPGVSASSTNASAATQTANEQTTPTQQTASAQQPAQSQQSASLTQQAASQQSVQPPQSSLWQESASPQQTAYQQAQTSAQQPAPSAQYAPSSAQPQFQPAQASQPNPQVRYATVQPSQPGQSEQPGQPQHAQVQPQHAQPQHAQPAKVKKERKPASSLAVFFAALLGVLLGAVITVGALYAFGGNVSGSNPSLSMQAIAALADTATPKTQIVTQGDGGSITITPISEDATLAEAVAAKALPSVVNIDVYTSVGNGPIDDYGTSENQNLEQYGLGSGVIISEDGYILTNYHVVEGGDEFLIRFDETTQAKATLVGQDVSSDLAVLKVDAENLTPIEIADSSQVRVGQWVMALGSPFGYEKSVSTGIVSALYRSTAMESVSGTNYYANMIQTDAAINPGNSGGALVDNEGRLIGINTLISSTSQSSAGVGFAIPSNYVMNVAEQIMSGKEVEHAYLGVSLQTVDASNASSFNTTADSGAYIENVLEGSPADEAGLREGDVIVRFGNINIGSASELVINVKGSFVGDVVTITVIRGGETLTFDVTMGSDKQ
jgi:putative serine protease PepD